MAKSGNIVKIWSFDKEEARLINDERSCKFLKKVRLPENIYSYNSFKETIEDTEIILHVTPSKFVRDILKQYKEYIKKQPLIMCSKGFEKDSLYTLDEVIKEEIPNKKYGVLSGPSHAEEVSIGIPTAMVIASEYDEVNNLVQDVFMNENVRIYTSKDVKGVELGGALKNIIAFCAGIATEIGLGDNSFAALITRGLSEINRLGSIMGGNKDTFYGLTGLGDLIVTCLSEHSRNRKAGKLIGKGMTVEEVKKEIGMTIESIDNIEVTYKLCKMYNVEMPIVETVYNVLYNKLSPKEAVKILMTRQKKSE